MENHSLREENRRLRLSEPVKRAQEMDAQTIAKLEKVFSELCDTEKNNRGTECPCLEGVAKQERAQGLALRTFWLPDLPARFSSPCYHLLS